MPTYKSYVRYTWFVLCMVFMVILAGGVVRMTQSGMGCPDWPRCFGRWIPPTSADQLPANYEEYLDKQDIDHTFNVYHTWIEYVNRLLGALLGVFIIIHLVWSVRKFWKTDRSIVLISSLLLFAVGFEGWLGKRVVDDNLEVVKITIHMLAALVLAALPLLIINRLKKQWVDAPGLKIISVAIIGLLLVQIVLGTQVREQVDVISKSLNYEQRSLWIGRLDDFFIIHRSFSWLIAAACLWLWWKARTYAFLRKDSVIILSLVAATVMLGIVMSWYNMPAIAQPLHLLLASILTIFVFAFRLRLK